jgi:hypothetical protein
MQRLREAGAVAQAFLQEGQANRNRLGASLCEYNELQLRIERQLRPPAVYARRAVLWNGRR